MGRKQKANWLAVQGADTKSRCVALRMKGYTYQRIGHELGISHQAAWEHVIKSLEQTRKETAENTEALRDIEIKRLDAILEKVLEKAEKKGDLHAVDRVISISRRRAELLGLDAPKQSHVTADVQSGVRIVKLPDNGRGGES